MSGWKNITLGQFQQLTDILTGQNFDDEVDRKVQLLAVLTGKDADHFASMPLDRFFQEATQTDFLSTGEIPGKPQRIIRAGGRRFKVVYEFRTLAAGQYIDAIAFSKGEVADRVPSLHNIMASIVVPMRRTWFGWREGKYGDMPHEEVANAMLDARFIDVYATALFFWEVWMAFISDTQGYLVHEMSKDRRMPKASLQALSNILQSGGDG